MEANAKRIEELRSADVNRRLAEVSAVLEGQAKELRTQRGQLTAITIGVCLLSLMLAVSVRDILKALG